MIWIDRVQISGLSLKKLLGWRFLLFINRDIVQLCFLWEITDTIIFGWPINI